MIAPQTRTRPAGTGRRFDTQKVQAQGDLRANGSAIGTLLGRLDRVRRTGSSSWMACCPSHPDKTPSLSITETADGTILLHDFGGCDPLSVLAAVGMTLADLFPRLRLRRTRRTEQEKRETRAEFNRHAWCAAVRVLAREAMVVLIAAQQLQFGRPLAADDHERLTLAMQRIDSARGVLA